MSYTAKTKNILPGLTLSPEKLYYSSWVTPVGVIYAAATLSGLCQITLGEMRERNFIRQIEALHGIRPHRKDAFFLTLKRELKRYFSGDLSAFSSPIAFLQGTPFERKVWRTLKTIPYGETRSYQWVSEQIGLPWAYRAVGGACGRNPLPIIIPCHRVISKSGKIGGYTGGISLKKRLLALEALHPFP
jgi:O-6-methylguanine DNA methyltransferase